MMLANQFSLTYDKDETSSPATVAFYLWEDQKVLEIINQLPKNSKNVRCLDIGCGTGRFERLFKEKVLAAHKNVELVGIDFSGGMLRQAQKSLLDLGVDPDKKDSSIKIERGVAEKLPFPKEHFDFVIMGFGVPSYTNYHLSLQESLRVLKKGGRALLSVYNDDAIYYSRLQDHGFQGDNPIAAQIDRSKRPYKLKVGNNFEIPVSTFSSKQFCDLLEDVQFKGSKFKVKRDLIGNYHIESFPSLYSCLGVNMTEGDGSETDLYKCDRFNKKVYELDVEFSKISPTTGYYLTITAEKE